MVSFLFSSRSSLGFVVVVVMVVVLLSCWFTSWSISLSLSPSSFTDFFHFRFQISISRVFRFLFCGCNVSSCCPRRSSITMFGGGCFSPLCMVPTLSGLLFIFTLVSFVLAASTCPLLSFFIHLRAAGGSLVQGCLMSW